jgi:urease accessory protein
MFRSNLLAVALTGALLSPALAHTGVGDVGSFTSGVAHPLGGTDHILAMIAVGLWAVLAGGRAIWVWPLTFVVTMLAGFAVASSGLPMPLVEPAISLSVVILGLFVALAVKAPFGLGAAIAGLFAFFHGHAHGAEATAVGLIAYATGFALATAGLHAAGIAVGVFVEASIGRAALRAIGGAQVLGGLALLAGLP